MLMLSFTALQWNDPDRLIWIGIYFTTALLALMALIELCESCVRAWAIVLCLIAIIMIALVFPGVVTFLQISNFQEIFSTMEDNKPYIEEMREFLGLLIITVYCIVIVFFQNKERPTKDSS